MDFELSDDQAALKDGVRKLCDGRFPMEHVRGSPSSPGGVDRTAWRELAEAGVFSLRIPEADGGVGVGLADAVLVFEELGRALVPGPLLATHLAAPLLPGAASGERVVGLIDGRKDVLVVEHLDALDDLLVLDDDAIRVIDPKTLDARPIGRPLDPLTPVHQVRVLPEGSRLGGPELVSTWTDEGATLAAAFLLGIAEATTDMAVAYAKQRVQFDRPIGTFQAIKHLLADMLVRTEMARAATYAAGVTLDDPVVGEPRRAAAGAKLMAGEAAIANGHTCIQVHGGMGFTWEVDAHLYLKRAWVLDTVFGSVDDQAEAMAAFL
ncbi:MAG TPA: acyl-CoA dehydrogenase family protein [Acidimicrobiales bacterium]|nr:acyl-CoA dehydrogenase family protein [Acidimicrobiales bacterium]